MEAGQAGKLNEAQVSFIQGIKDFRTLYSVFSRAKEAGKVRQSDWLDWIKTWNLRPVERRKPRLTEEDVKAVFGDTYAEEITSQQRVQADVQTVQPSLLHD